MHLRAELIGYLGGDPEMRYTPSGKPVATFSVACNEVWIGDDGQKHEKTTWVRVTTWDKRAETCAKYLRKGSMVYVEGKPASSGWIDKQSGEVRTTVEVTATNVRFLNGGGKDAQSAQVTDTQITEENIPF